jgi:competence protein ComEA
VEPSATPWRVLEDPPERTGGGAAPTGATSAGSSPLNVRSTVAIAAGAVLLAVVAFFLAFGMGSGGTVLLDGGQPLGSSAVPAAGDGFVGPRESAPPELVVEIVGAVERPGVYRVPSNARIGDLVDAAGGYGARVDANRASRELNLAALLHDGDQIRVPSRDDEQPAGGQSGSGDTGSGSATAGGDGLVDLNRASAAELEALPGIGPVTAGKILTSREEQPFAAVEDLRARKLVGEKTFETIKGLVAVR